MPAAVHPAQRLWYSVRVNDETNCWEWTGTKNKQGYGLILVYGKHRSTHRFVYELMVGDIPPGDGYFGTCVLHRCDNRACLNPAHLFLGSHKENMQDMAAKGRTGKPKRAIILATGKCLKGLHDWVPENVITKDDGRERCRACTMERVRVSGRKKYARKQESLGKTVRPWLRYREE